MSPASNPTAPSGWDLARGFGYVGVVDNGIEPTHPDLQQNFRQHFSRAFYDQGCSATNLMIVDERGANAVPADCQNAPVGQASPIGHGTHVAALIGATPNGSTPNNPTGVAGVCWNCSLIVVKASEYGSTLMPTLATSGINHSIIMGAQVINYSGGKQAYLEEQWGPAWHSCSQLSPGTDAFCDALAFAELRQVIVVAAAGNQNNVKSSYYPTSLFATNFPASEPNVVSVGGTVYGDALWTDDPLPGYMGLLQGTNLDKLDFVAPAKRILSAFYRGGSWFNFAWCSDSTNGSYYPSEGYGYDECTGTSMAAPIVTGALAAARSLNPLLSRATLVSTSKNAARIVAGSYKMPNALAAAQAISATNGAVTPMFALWVSGTNGSPDNRLFTTAPQMAVAGIKGTMLPTLNYSSAPVYYRKDTNAPMVSPQYQFPDVSRSQRDATAYFKVYTQHQVSGIPMAPLYRLSKAQDIGNGRDACGFLPPISKANQVQHIYTISDTEKNQLTTPTQGNCFNFDGIEGYVAPYQWTGSLQQLYRLYNPSADSYILVPSSKLSTATALGYTQGQTALGWVVPN